MPADFLEITPFTTLFTRITSDDDLYKGLSSFFVEMQELKSVLKFADSHSIVLGDEVCRGTEDVSGMAIVASCIDTLLERNSKFIFATHLHKLPKLALLKGRTDLKIKHMAVTVTNADAIVFDRKLVDGQGDTLYGLEIAQCILDNPEFCSKAHGVRKEITKGTGKLIRERKSRYNSNVIMTSCEICESCENLDTHHIIHQASSELKGRRKHSKGNLVVLCKDCHHATHHGNLEIKGWIQTSNGKILEYVRNE